MNVSRAARINLPVPILYRRMNDDRWFQAKIVNLSESGVFFGPTELQPGALVEVMLSPPIQVGSFAIGKQICAAEVVRTTETGVAAVRFGECRFLLEALRPVNFEQYE